MFRIGIDPGVSGGLAVVRKGWINLAATPLLPKTGRNNEHDVRGMYDLLRPYKGKQNVAAVLEAVHFDDRDDGRRRKAEILIRNQEAWKVCLTFCGIPFEELAPQTWRKRSGVPYGLTDEIAIVQEAIRRYPQTAKILKRRSSRSPKGYVYQHNLAEALLMSDALLKPEDQPARGVFA